MTQNEMILGHMLEGKSITALDALNLYGCMRLGARVYDLKRDGYPIESRMITVGPNDKRVSVYWMDLNKLPTHPIYRGVVKQ